MIVGMGGVTGGLAYIFGKPYVDARRHHAAVFGTLADSMRRAAAKSTHVTLLEGLPHPRTERDVFDKEMKSAKHVLVAGHAFYANVIEPDAADVVTLQSVMTDASGIKPTLGVKFCGGFHPDWLVHFEADGNSVDCLCCFGCGEMSIESKSDSVTVDFNRLSSDILFPLFLQYRTNRPEPVARF